MRLVTFFSMFIAGLTMITGADAASRGRVQTTTSVNNKSVEKGAPAASKNKSTGVTKPAATARAGRNTTVVKPAATARAGRNTTVVKPAPATGGAKPGVAARAAAKQKVVSNGTKVAVAVENTTVSEECKTKYMGCMDSFCMLDNETGGRCLCNDRKADLDLILAEIEKLDQQSYQMATFGIERIEMGDDADQVIAQANKVAEEMIKKSDKDNDKVDLNAKTMTRKALDLSLWDNSLDFEDDDEEIFEEAKNISPIEGKEGEEMHQAAAKICMAQIPECTGDIQMLQLMYAQQIKSDCAAYENTLKQKKTASAQKLATAEKGLREAALEKLREANKYDLGQCTVEFKKCMQTTAGCGEDFSGCATVVAVDTTNARFSGNAQGAFSGHQYAIKGVSTNIMINKSTYDTLFAKKPLCESVTKSCVAVAGQVWDTFIREAAPQIKSAELIAEDNVRQNCVGKISECFQKACRENIGSEDSDGSYDMCLTRPGTMLNACRVPLEACGINASNEAEANKSDLWDYILARLASMRVDSCTTAIKSCLQSEDICGEDYTQCVGLDTDTIIRMCPYDKLVGCQQKYGNVDIASEDVYDNIYNMVQGIMLNIDNNMLTKCQKAAEEAMIKVCGDVETCTGLAVDDTAGVRTLDYQICAYELDDDGKLTKLSNCRTNASQIADNELGKVDGVEADKKTGVYTALGKVESFAGVIDGIIYWDRLELNDEGLIPTYEDYIAGGKSTEVDEAIKAARAEGKTIIEKELDDGKIEYQDELGNLIGIKTSTEGMDDEIASRVPLNINETQAQKIRAELSALRSKFEGVVNSIEADPTVQYCMNGRKVQGMETKTGQGETYRKGEGTGKVEGKDIDGTDDPRFPDLTKQMRTVIATAALNQAQANYYEKYDKLYEQMTEDQTNIINRILKAASGNAKEAKTEVMRRACLNVHDDAYLQKFGGQASITSTLSSTVGLLTDKDSTIVKPFTSQADASKETDKRLRLNSVFLNLMEQSTSSTVGALSANARVLDNRYKKVDVAAKFEPNGLVCNRCVTTTICKKVKKKLFGRRYCAEWFDPTTECSDIQY